MENQVETEQKGRGGSPQIDRAGDVTQLAGALAFLIERPKLPAAMGAAGRALVATQHTPENHCAALTSLYEQLASDSIKTGGPSAVAKPALRVAFIGGREVISKYSGIGTYYEEIGKRLAEMGHDPAPTSFFSDAFLPRRTATC